jgi:hypothetical protein
MTKGRRLAATGLLTMGAVLGAGAPASAELVFFTTGRVLSVESHRVEGTSLVLVLRGGGSVVCPASLVDRVEPDEVPHPAAASELAAGQGDGPRPADGLGAAGRFEPLIDEISARHEVDGTLVRAVIQVESGYRERARSRKGAMGLMQLMPATAKQYIAGDPYDPAANIDAGIRHLKSLLERLPLPLALAAYNAGEAAVTRYRGIPPYPETRAYVARVLALAGR